jgi:bifunctional non-homologous end joining protein LigD
LSGSLRTYRAKRDFETTPEPRGEAPEGSVKRPRFVVQEHSARSLHWDLRLEHDGVLLSWAVPRGIPDDPDDNRLAVRTEDHPLEYLDFHGEIPEGEYGAGTMTIYDRGTYEPEKLRDDEVIAVFHGERMNGRYALFRTRGKDWMIHRMDPPVDPDREPMPERLQPMLARIGPLPPDADGRWAYEVKWDGIRTLAWIEGGRVRLCSRNGNDITSRYPELRELGRALGARPAILDGEIVAFDAEGRPSFERLQSRMNLANEAAVRRAVRDVPIAYMLFDVLYLDGHTTFALPYVERRELLEGLELTGPHWQTPAYRRSDAEALLRLSADRGLEGVVAKRLDSRYEPGRRSTGWVKVKNKRHQSVVIGGWVPGEGRRSSTIGALLVGVPGEDGTLDYAGRVGTGFTERTLRELQARLEKLRTDRSPFDGRKPPRLKGAVWVEPRLVAEVEFAEWTRTRTLRAPSFKGLRDDVDPQRIDREEEESDDVAAIARALAGAGRSKGSVRVEVEISGRTLSLSNLDKIMYPAVGFTKGQVIDYYARIGPTVLPHLRDRPLTLKRYPDGIAGEYFYEKQSPPVLGSDRGAVEPPQQADDRIHARPGPADARVAGQPGRHRAAHLALPGLRHHAPDHARVRPRPGRAGRRARVRPGRALGARPVRAARPRDVREDVGLEGAPGLRAAEHRRDLRSVQAVRAGGRPAAREAAPRARGLEHGQGATQGESARGLEPERRAQDHRERVLASRARAPDRLDAAGVG